MSKARYDRMLKRANALGDSSGDRVVEQARRGFMKALQSTTESEMVSFDGQEYRALVIMEKAFGDGADKRIICTPFETPLTTGKLVYVSSTGREWLTFNVELRNKAYNRFMVKEVNETITWRSRDNEVFQTGAVVGTLTGENVLTKAEGRFGYWKNSERVYCYIPITSDTPHIEVDKNIVMNKETWKVLAVNSIQEEGILALQLTKWKNDDMLDEIPEIQIIGPNQVKTYFGTDYTYEIKGFLEEENYTIKTTNMVSNLENNIVKVVFEEEQVGTADIEVYDSEEQLRASMRIELLPPY